MKHIGKYSGPTPEMSRDDKYDDINVPEAILCSNYEPKTPCSQSKENSLFHVTVLLNLITVYSGF